MWPFKKKEPKPVWSPETQAKIDEAKKIGEWLRQKSSNNDAIKILQPFSYVVIGDEKLSYGMILTDTKENARAEAAADWYRKGGADRINTIRVCEFEEDELRALFMSMREYLK